VAQLHHIALAILEAHLLFRLLAHQVVAVVAQELQTVRLVALVVAVDQQTLHSVQAELATQVHILQ
jgi:hypothetical protein